jgi:hypothetical protein
MLTVVWNERIPMLDKNWLAFWMPLWQHFSVMNILIVDRMEASSSKRLTSIVQYELALEIT